MKQIRTIIMLLAAGLCAFTLPIIALQHTQAEQKRITSEERDVLSQELTQALSSGNHKRAQNAINMGADVNYREINWPPLFFAVHRGDITAIKMLLAQPNLNINLTSQNGLTLFEMINEITNNRLEMFKLLLSAPGFNPNIVSSKGDTPLWKILHPNNPEKEVLKLLLAVPTLEINSPAGGMTPIAYMVRKSTYASTQAEQENLYTIIRIMLEHGADPYIKAATGKNAFDGLFDETIIDILKEGREAYLDKLRAQQEAAETKKVLEERQLLPARVARLVGEYIYPTDIQEERPTQTFVSASSTATGSTEQKKVASEHKHAAAQEQAVATETKISAEAQAQANQELIKAVENESLTGIKAALKNGADINTPNYRGFKKTALMAAATAGLLEMTTYLLTVNTIDLNAQDAGGHTALIWAIREKHPNIVRLLLQHGAAPNIDDASGNDAYMWSKNSTAEIRKILEDYKAAVAAAGAGAAGAGSAGR